MCRAGTRLKEDFFVSVGVCPFLPALARAAEEHSCRPGVLFRGAWQSLFLGKQTLVNLGTFSYTVDSLLPYTDTCHIGIFELVKLPLWAMRNHRILQGLNHLFLK